MKHLIIYILLVSTNLFAQDFTGDWEYESNMKKKDIPSSTFNLTLKQHGNLIYGTYCSVFQYGNRIDCDEDSTILGKVINKNKALIKFNSSFGAKNGEVQLSINKHNQLYWKLIKKPKGSEFYVPVNGVLQKRRQGN